MIKAIDSKFCQGNSVELTKPSSRFNLILNTDEIILLKIDNRVIINKYNLMPKKHVDSNGNYNILFNYNKLYLSFMASMSDYNFEKDCFFKGTNRALHFNEKLESDIKKASNNQIELNRNEVEKLFNKDLYDSMYIFSNRGKVLFANNKTDGLIINNIIVPNNEEITIKELRDRVIQYNILSELKQNKNYEYPQIKSIDEIKNYRIIGQSPFDTYSYLFLTSKNNEFNLQWIKLDFIEKDKFLLTTNHIPTIEPTVDDVLDYSQKYNIRNEESNQYVLKK